MNIPVNSVSFSTLQGYYDSEGRGKWLVERLTISGPFLHNCGYNPDLLVIDRFKAYGFISGFMRTLRPGRTGPILRLLQHP